MLSLKAHEKEIENLTPTKEFVRGTVGAKCKITFDEFWQPFEKTVVFKREYGEPKNIVVSSMETDVEIPYEILEESGKFKVGVFGNTESETLPTLYSDYIEIKYGTDTYGTSPIPYTPSEIEQLRLSKQDKLTAGDGIEIDENNVISSNVDVEIDQTYNPTSENAQSGKAVAQAIANIEIPETSGANGATFTPYVSSAGVISWTNDKGLDNPAPVNIKGPQGEKGEQGIQGLQGEKGEKGDDYILTDADKDEIADIVIDILPKWNGGDY